MIGRKEPILCTQYFCSLKTFLCYAVQETRVADRVEMATDLAAAILIPPLFDGRSASAQHLHMCAAAELRHVLTGPLRSGL